MGTGLGAKPIANTDIFCFAAPDTKLEDVPKGVLHPRRVFRGVVGGVRDYGNRMGIPTVNGAVYFDERYLANPLVYCGNVGLLPADAEHRLIKYVGNASPNAARCALLSMASSNAPEDIARRATPVEPHIEQNFKLEFAAARLFHR